MNNAKWIIITTVIINLIFWTGFYIGQQKTIIQARWELTRYASVIEKQFKVLNDICDIAQTLDECRDAVRIKAK